MATLFVPVLKELPVDVPDPPEKEKVAVGTEV